MEPIDENEEHVINETVNNESYVGDLEANNVQQPSLGMEFESQEDAYSFYVNMLKVSDLVYPLKVVAVQKFLENLLM